jgi:hypothetical protein
MKNLFKKLVLIRSQIEGLSKQNRNEQQNYDYVSSSQVLDSVRRLMDEHGIFVYPNIEYQDLQQSPSNASTKQFLTILDIKYNVVDVDSGENIEISWKAQGMDSSEKGVGKALTYGEKYFFLKLFQIPTDKDDPDAGSAPREERRVSGPVDQKMSDAQRKKIWAMGCQIWGSKDAKEKLEKMSPVKSSEMSKKQASALIEKLTAISEGAADDH